jgi:hypothetical protein
MEDDHLIQNGATTGKLLALVVLPAQSTLGAAISQDNYADTNPGADSKKIAYASTSEQSSNPEGDAEVYSMNALEEREQRTSPTTASKSATTSPISPPTAPGSPTRA